MGQLTHGVWRYLSDIPERQILPSPVFRALIFALSPPLLRGHIDRLGIAFGEYVMLRWRCWRLREDVEWQKLGAIP